ncbi:luciferin 4-monooxygenase-like [Pararge aegeria]|uniref:Jg7127 protein n=1 Tax=Pararge aegeria aegeria TaxID=348720 RepID=A0A8S4SCR1_9NEOP|nr:luciferin 4-monooxygenase-like [Pararge aegeria]CAH2255794.1 jg7127 [Pararge aegeria aegeria]
MPVTDEFYVFGDQNIMVPVHLNFGKYILDRLRQMKGAIALVNGTTGETLTIRQLLQYSVNLASSLSTLGIGNGDVIAVGSEKRITFLPTLLGVLFTGASCTPYALDLYSSKAVLRQKLSLAKPTHLICSKLFWERHEEVLNSCDSIKSHISFDCFPQNALTIKELVAKDIDIDRYEPAGVLGQVDTAFILYSSGTTGAPKGIRLTHLNSIMSSLPEKYMDEWNIQTAYVLGGWYFNYDTFMTFKLLLAGKKVVYIDDVTVLNMLKCIEKYQVNILMVVPYHLNLLIKTESLGRFNLDALKIIYSRSTLLHKNTIEQLKQRLPKLQHILQGYGMTECGEPTSEIRAVKGPKPGSVGMAAPGITMKIVDLKTNIKLGPNQHGEIRVRGPMLMMEYIGVDPSTYLDEEGFLKTGDVGYYDDENYFYIVERNKYIINNQGNKIAPLELENLLEMHPKVLEASVIGKPDPDDGELAMAFVVKRLESDVTEQELIDYIASEVPQYMQLKGGVKFIHELPRSPRGKILRHQLGQMLN